MIADGNADPSAVEGEGSRDVQPCWQPVVGQITRQLREYFVSSRVLPSEGSADRVIEEAISVLSRCTRPGSLSSVRTGLVCGYVQSGKTASMTAVAALAKDNGFRIIILMAGVTTNLVEQNRDRLENHLRAAAPEWSWLMLTNPQRAASESDIEGLLQEWRSQYYTDDDRRTLFITVMKNHSHLGNLADLLRCADLSDAPAIVFDDEADQASLNTRPHDPVASSTYRRIGELRHALPQHTYLQYTATPQAPLLITRIDSLSADFAELVSPGEGYTGGQVFFGQQGRHVRLIPGGEIFPDGQLPLEPPVSLINAMQAFFVGVAAGRLGNDRSHRSMLIHPSKSTATHNHYYNWADRLKSYWHRVLVRGCDADRADLLSSFRDAYLDLSETCEGMPPFEQITSRLPAAINQTVITPVNSVDGREVPWKNSYSHILVGGEKLGRGYTVKGLTVTYMPRSPGGWTADTIQQRARFFGYHRAYWGYCRVYLHPSVRDVYVAYVSHEQDMRSRLAEHRGQPLREWRRMFYLNQQLAPTRRNVLSDPWMRASLRNGWFGPRAPQFSPLDGEQNSQILARLESLRFEAIERYSQHSSAIVYLRDIYEQVLVPLSYFYENDALGLCVANCNLKAMLDRDEMAQCMVIRMHGGQERTRNLRNGLIPQLFQGHSSAGLESYPGDRAFFHPRLPTLQLHALRLQEGNQDYGRVRVVAIRLEDHEPLVLHRE